MLMCHSLPSSPFRFLSAFQEVARGLATKAKRRRQRTNTRGHTLRHQKRKARGCLEFFFSFVALYGSVVCTFQLTLLKQQRCRWLLDFKEQRKSCNLLHYAIHFRKTSVHKISTVWSRCVVHKEPGREHYILNLFLSFIFFCFTSFLGSKLDSEGNLPIVEGSGVNRSR